VDAEFAPGPVFYYDLGRPECYLVAERIMAALPAVPEWEPVHLAPPAAVVDRAAIERRAQELALQKWRWPPTWPPESGLAMRAATYAKQVGRAVAFSLAAFRQAYAGGRDLGSQDTVLIAAAACEMHPTAVLKAIGLRSVTEALDAANARAYAAGVRSVPAIQIGASVLEGEDCVERAAALLGDHGVHRDP
jgi:2-hydroxychromene-2-carboxylate isomerase